MTHTCRHCGNETSGGCSLEIAGCPLNQKKERTMRVVVFDVETTGLPKWEIPSDDPSQPHIIQLAAVKYDEEQKEISRLEFLVKPEGWEMPPEIVKFNEEHGTGITMEKLAAEGKPIAEVIEAFMSFIEDCDRIVAHNLSFDRRMVRIELKRLGKPERADEWKLDNRHFCTMKESTNIVKMDFKKPKPGMYKSPKLVELYQHCFQSQPDASHDAMADALATAECYFHLFAHHPAPTFSSSAEASGGAAIGFTAGEAA